MAGITPAQDAFGFGRLGQMKIAKRSEAREERRLGIAEKSANQNLQLGQMQISQMKRNLEAIKVKETKKKTLMQGVSGAYKSETGKSKYANTWVYLSMMEQDPEYADMASEYREKLEKNEEDVLDGLKETGDKEAFINRYNEGIGAATGSYVEDIKSDPIKGDLLTLVDKDGNKSYGWATESGEFHPFTLPEGMSIDVVEDDYLLSESEVEFLAEKYNTDHLKPFPVRGKEANSKNSQVIERATQLSIEKGKSGEEQSYDVKERKNIQNSLLAQEKQRGSMISFVENLGKQVDHVKTVANDIKSFDTRLFNKPAIWIKKKLAGSPEFSKYEVYLGEIQSEIGKLSSGSTASVSELSEGAREKWEKILDENLSIKDMLEVLEEVKEAGNIRMDSVDYGIKKTKERLRNVGKKDKKKPIDNNEKKGHSGALELLRLNPNMLPYFIEQFGYTPEGY